MGCDQHTDEGDKVNSNKRASLCTYICLKPGYALVNEAGYRIRNQLFCRCNGMDCEWEGQAYDGKCRDYDEYRLNIQKEVNHVVMKKYFKAVAVPVNLKIAKFAGGSNSKRVKKKVKKLKRLGKASKRIATRSFMTSRGQEQSGRSQLL